MRKLISSFIVVLVIIVLNACNSATEDIQVSEVSIEEVDHDVKRFVAGLELEKDEASNGIYLYTSKSDKSKYLYLSQEFLSSDNIFGDIDVINSEDSLHIYVSENSTADKEVQNYRLYQIDLGKQYDVIKVFKNDQETYFQVIGG